MFSVSRSWVPDETPDAVKVARFMNDPKNQANYNKQIAVLAALHPSVEVGVSKKRRAESRRLFHEFRRRIPAIPDCMEAQNEFAQKLRKRLENDKERRKSQERLKTKPFSLCEKTCSKALKLRNQSFLLCKPEIADSVELKKLLELDGPHFKKVLSRAMSSSVQSHESPSEKRQRILT